MSVKNSIVTAMVMPGGWHYYNPLKDGKQHKIEAQSYEELERTVLRFRLEQIVLVDATRADPESVAEDIKAYICTHFPNSCVDRAAGHPSDLPAINGDEQTFRQFIPLISRIAEWFGNLSITPRAFVAPATADKRAGICASCPRNIRFETTCGPCNQQIRTNTIHLLGHRTTRFDSQLLGCRELGHSNRAAVWLDLEPVSSENLPHPCWMRTTS